jgi:hypothetical protein
MDPIITSFLSELQVGELRVFKNMGIIPLNIVTNNGPEYLLLKEALDKKLISITEISHAGAVPKLRVFNKFSLSVLLLDGEELIGAKQNRVLNTTILFEGNSQTIIPVSCTEHGRWRYKSAKFSHSDIIMSHRSRASKAHTVTESLHGGRGFSSDQQRVWANIGGMHREAGTSSPTHAMRDVYTSKREELDMYLRAFDCESHQEGSLVFINGAPVGFDVVSDGLAYKAFHPKLIKSYAIDAILQRKDDFDEPSVDKAKALLQEVQYCKESKYPSVGQGYDYRFEGESVVGSALVLNESVIHLAFFKLDKNEKVSKKLDDTQRKNNVRGRG